FREAFHLWHKDNPAMLSASISYFSFFSFVPALVIFVAVAGHMFEVHVPKQRIFYNVSNMFNPQAAMAVPKLIASPNKSAAPATIFGVLFLMWGSSRAFWAIQNALNMIWGVGGKPLKVHHFVMDRVKAFLMICGVGVLLTIFFLLDLGWAFVKRKLRM